MGGYISTGWKRSIAFGHYETPPWGLHWRSNTFFIISSIGIGMFTDIFLYALVVPVTPFMLEDRIHLGPDQIQSQVSNLLAIYGASTVIASPIVGWAADKITSRQIPFMAGLVLLLTGTLMFAAGQTVAALALARVLQGVSGAIVWTLGLAMCLETVGPENMGKAIGTIFSFIGIGTLTAPVLGGALYRASGYSGVFGLGASLLAIDFFMRLLVIEKKVARRYADYYQSSESETSSVHDADVESTTSANDEGDRVYSSTDGATDEESPLLSNEEREDSPYRLPEQHSKWIKQFPILICFKDPALIAATWQTFVQAFILGSFDATIPTVARDYFGFDSLKAGLLFLGPGGTDLLLGPFVGWAVDKYGTKGASVIGYLYATPMFILLRLVHPGGTKQIALYASLLALNGFGLALIGTPPIVESGAVTERYYAMNPEVFGSKGPYAQLYGINSAVFSAGLAAGPLISGHLKDSIGYGNMNLVVAGVCLVTAVVSWLYIGGRPSLLSKVAGDA
ncbi:MFS transporter-like protein [Patellaria atrata CBS 101060]|uniref:MFS transporter-like protein n=1 Tax=Patellaria atrata CBS 101060 TaxID=1346257 RepID=A0A9P4SBK9_9PEZI|nr:MFS transporter-like protein [Patellaria atrata CBS 101060]